MKKLVGKHQAASPLPGSSTPNLEDEKRRSDKERKENLMARPYWQPDSDVDSCNACKSEFTITFRRHHCRFCGLIFCDRCCHSKREMPPSFGYEKPQRTCKSCLALVDKTNAPRRLSSSPLSAAASSSASAALAVTPVKPYTSNHSHGHSHNSHNSNGNHSNLSTSPSSPSAPVSPAPAEYYTQVVQPSGQIVYIKHFPPEAAKPQQPHEQQHKQQHHHEVTTRSVIDINNNVGSGNNHTPFNNKFSHNSSNVTSTPTPPHDSNNHSNNFTFNLSNGKSGMNITTSPNSTVNDSFYVSSPTFLHAHDIKTIIFDLDETLAHGISPANDFYKTHPLVSMNPPIVVMFRNIPMHIYLRPGADMLLKYVLKHFKVAVWTHAQRDWAETILSLLLPNEKDRSKLCFVFTSENATLIHHTGDKVKDLSKIFRDEKYRGLGFEVTSTLIVEDSPENCVLNNVNSIFVPEFTGMPDDNILYFLTMFIYHSIGKIQKQQRSISSLQASFSSAPSADDPAAAMVRTTHTWLRHELERHQVCTGDQCLHMSHKPAAWWQKKKKKNLCVKSIAGRTITDQELALWESEMKMRLTPSMHSQLSLLSSSPSGNNNNNNNNISGWSITAVAGTTTPKKTSPSSSPSSSPSLTASPSSSTTPPSTMQPLLLSTGAPTQAMLGGNNYVGTAGLAGNTVTTNYTYLRPSPYIATGRPF